MLPAERRQSIAEAITHQPSVRTEDLATRFGVSTETIRRDLLRLEEAGELSRVYGGATPVTPAARRRSEGSYAAREESNVEGKRRIAALAVQEIKDGQTVFMDIGTTIVQVAQAVPRTWAGRVVTSSLLVATELAAHPDVEVLVCGGKLREGDLTLTGSAALAFLGEYYADLAFLGSGGVDATVGLTDYHPDEVDLRRVMMHNSARCLVLADATKLDVIAPRRVCSLNEMGALVTDGELSPALALAVQAAGVTVLRP